MRYSSGIAGGKLWLSGPWGLSLNWTDLCQGKLAHHSNMVQKQGLVLFVPAWHGTQGKLEGNAETEAATQICPVTKTSKCSPEWACLYGRKSDYNWIYLVIRNILFSFSGSSSTVSSIFSSSSQISKQTKIPLSRQSDSKQFLIWFQFDSVWNR